MFRIFSYLVISLSRCLVAVQDNEQEVRKEAVRVIEACLNLFGSLDPSYLRGIGDICYKFNCIFLNFVMETPYHIYKSYKSYKSYIRHVGFGDLVSFG